MATKSCWSLFCFVMLCFLCSARQLVLFCFVEIGVRPSAVKCFVQFFLIWQSSVFPDIFPKFCSTVLFSFVLLCFRHCVVQLDTALWCYVSGKLSFSSVLWCSVMFPLLFSSVLLCFVVFFSASLSCNSAVFCRVGYILAQNCFVVSWC